MHLGRVQAKARVAVRRRAEQIEADEIEGGEINLVPYLDIVTNLMLFLLAGLSSAYFLREINTTLPNHTPVSASAATDPTSPPDDQPLQLTVSVEPDELVLWSISGLEGTFKDPLLRLAGPTFELPRLNQALYEIANRRWRGTQRKRRTYEIILQINGDVPYETVVMIMDHVRRKLPPAGTAASPIAYPTIDENTQEFLPYRYDPDTHPLFFDILFTKERAK